MRKQRHFVSNVRESERIADCRECGSGVPVVLRANPARWACATARREQGSRKRVRPRSPEAKRADHLRRQFGLTPADYEALALAQNDVCGICEEPCSTGRRLAVDHAHGTGEIRGLLCGNCNRAIGLMKDSPERLLRAVQYLNRS